MLPEIRVEIRCEIIKLPVKCVVVETDTIDKYYLMTENNTHKVPLNIISIFANILHYIFQTYIKILCTDIFNL